MSKERFEVCALRGYCYPESAIYIVDRSMANCVLSAFFNMSFSIDDCNVELLRSENLYPYSIRISSKQHLIVTDQLISFTISCNSRVSRQVINPPMGFINLNRGCRATNSNIMLLSKTVLNSSAVDTDSFTEFEFQKSDIWNMIETKLGPKFHFLKNTMEKLPKNTPVNIRKLQTLLNERVLTVL